MDAAPRGLAPSGPGATGAPLLDWILCDPGLAASVLGHLAPADVRGLRASCKAACAAVAGHAWDSPAATAAVHAWAWPPPSLGARVRAAAEGGNALVACYSRPPPPPPEHHSVAGGAAAVARWRACFPAAHGVVVLDRRSVHDAAAVSDADVAALAAGGGQLTRLGLVGCARLADGALAPLTGLTSLALERTPSLSGACWGGGLAGRLRSVTTAGVPVTDGHLPALGGCTHVDLGDGACVSDAGVAAHLSAQVSHLGLDVTAEGEGKGAGPLSAKRRRRRRRTAPLHAVTDTRRRHRTNRCARHVARHLPPLATPTSSGAASRYPYDARRQLSLPLRRPALLLMAVGLSWQAAMDFAAVRRKRASSRLPSSAPVVAALEQLLCGGFGGNGRAGCFSAHQPWSTTTGLRLVVSVCRPRTARARLGYTKRHQQNTE
jgi:hypothetical protein